MEAYFPTFIDGPMQKAVAPVLSTQTLVATGTKGTFTLRQVDVSWNRSMQTEERGEVFRQP